MAVSDHKYDSNEKIIIIDYLCKPCNTNCLKHLEVVCKDSAQIQLKDEHTKDEWFIESLSELMKLVPEDVNVGWKKNEG